MFHFHAAGIEHVYDFLDHILGKSGEYSGVPMHTGHYKGHTNSFIKMMNGDKVRPFFNDKYWREFIVTGAALWMQSLPQACHEPCCDLDLLGCDGTSLGIRLSEATSCVPVWQPEVQKAPTLRWGRFDRCVIPSPYSLSTSQRRGIAEAKSFCKHILACSTSDRSVDRKRLEEFLDHIPKPIYEELIRWSDIEPHTVEWLALQRLLRAAVSDESVTGVISSKIVSPMRQLLHTSRPRAQRK
jgi:hypothetical protein